MNSIYWNWIHSITVFNELMLNSLANFMKDCQQSTLWIGNTNEVALAGITIHETRKRISIKALISDVDINNIDIQVSRETILIQGRLGEKTGVDGYFDPGQFQTLIPLPRPVDPQTASAELKHDVLIIRLFKQKAMQPSRIRIEPMNSTGIFPQMREQKLELETDSLHYLNAN